MLISSFEGGIGRAQIYFLSIFRTYFSTQPYPRERRDVTSLARLNQMSPYLAEMRWCPGIQSALVQAIWILKKKQLMRHICNFSSSCDSSLASPCVCVCVCMYVCVCVCHCNVSGDKAIRKAYILKTAVHRRQEDDSSGLKRDPYAQAFDLLWCWIMWTTGISPSSGTPRPPALKWNTAFLTRL